MAPYNCRIIIIIIIIFVLFIIISIIKHKLVIVKLVAVTNQQLAKRLNHRIHII